MRNTCKSPQVSSPFSLRHWCQTLYACSSQMGPRWSSVSYWKRLRCWAHFFVLKPGWFLEEEDGTRGPCLASPGSRRPEEGRRKAGAEAPFPSPGACSLRTLLFKASVPMEEAALWFYTWSLTRREPPSHHHGPDVKHICLHVFWFLQIHLQGTQMSRMTKPVLPEGCWGGEVSRKS